MITQCRGCGKLSEAVICFACGGRLRARLLQAAWVWRELQIAITRQVVMNDPFREGGNSSETPLHFDDVASEAAWVLENTIRAWSREVARDNEPAAPADVRELSVWLAARVIRLLRLPDIADCYAEIKSAVELGIKAIDRYHRDEVSDPEVKARARELFVTANEAQRYLGEVNGRKVSSNTIRSWAKRGLLEQVHPHYYRLGDILDMYRKNTSGKTATQSPLD